MNGTTTQLSTLPTPAAAAPAPQGVPDPKNGAAPPASSEGSETPSGAAPPVAKTTPDPSDEISERLEVIAKRESKNRRLEAEHHERMSKLSAREKEIEAKLAELDAALGDPVKYMLDKGKDPVAVAKRFSQPETPEEKRIRMLEEKDAKREAEAKAREEKAAKDAEEGQRFHVVRSFVSEITEENSPNLVALYQAKEVPNLVSELLDRPYVHPQTGKQTGETVLQTFKRIKGRNPTNEEIRKSLEAEASSRATKIIEANRQREAARQAAASQSPDRANQQVPPTRGTGPSGISNQGASVTNAGKTRKLSLEERRKQARQELTQALEAEAGDRE